MNRADSAGNEVAGRLPVGVISRPDPFGRWEREDPSYDGEGELEVDVHGERPDITESIPHSAAHGKVNRLDLNRQCQSMDRGGLGNVGLHVPQAPSHLPFARDGSFEPQAAMTEIGQSYLRLRRWRA